MYTVPFKKKYEHPTIIIAINLLIRKKHKKGVHLELPEFHLSSDRGWFFGSVKFCLDFTNIFVKHGKDKE
jgi:hypothetical protein